MGIYIGLLSANITLEAMHYNKSMDVNFNERYTLLQHSNQIIEFEYTRILLKIWSLVELMG